MSDTPEREMTLAEWVGKLYEGHTARVELAALERELAEARGGLQMAYERGREARESALKALAELTEAHRAVAWLHQSVCPTLEYTPDIPQNMTVISNIVAGERAEVEAAFRAGYSSGGDDMSAAHHNEYYEGEDAAWSRYQQEREGGEGR